MADIAELADDQEVLRRARVAGLTRPTTRRFDSCDCNSRSAEQQFCGDASCRDAREEEEWRAARVACGQAIVHMVRR